MGVSARGPATGLPRTFRDLPTLEHVAVWAPAGPRALVYGPYVALLVSLHGTGLYQRHDFTRDTLEEAEAARRFMNDGAEFEAHLLRQMSGDLRYAASSTPEAVARNRRLIAAWDALSLALCGGIEDEYGLRDIPAAEGTLSIQVKRVDVGRERFSVEPWPFVTDTVRLVCVGRQIKDTFTHQEAMRDAVSAAPWVTLELELTPPGSTAPSG